MMNADQNVKFQEEKNGKVVILRIDGRIDAVTSPSTEKKILGYIKPDQNNLLLDLTKVSYMSSAGLRVIVTVAKKISESSGKLVLFSLTPFVKELLKASHLDQVFEIADSEEKALRKF